MTNNASTNRRHCASRLLPFQDPELLSRRPITPDTPLIFPILATAGHWAIAWSYSAMAMAWAPWACSCRPWNNLASRAAGRLSLPPLTSLTRHCSRPAALMYNKCCWYTRKTGRICSGASNKPCAAVPAARFSPGWAPLNFVTVNCASCNLYTLFL